MVIIVTGSVGTGKTATAKKIAKGKKLEYVDVNELIRENKLYSYYNKKDKNCLIYLHQQHSFCLFYCNKNIIYFP